MFKILDKLPMDCYIAFSGGRDSVAFATYLIKNPKRKVTLLHYNHNFNTEDKNSYEFSLKFAKENSLNIITDINNVTNIAKYNKGYENHCRELRYDFLFKFTDKPIIVCHHLKDNIESWLLGSINGQPKLIPYRNKNVIRPFMLVSDTDLGKYCSHNSLEWYEDKTNTDINIPRNRMRHIILPELLKINPGIDKVIRKRILYKYHKENI